MVRRGGTVVLGSAAALTLGSHAVPVYEIYKVGEDPEWVEGLDLLGELTGVAAAVVPHYDNKEGATHDTRFCYLGEDAAGGAGGRSCPTTSACSVSTSTPPWSSTSRRAPSRWRATASMSVRRRGDTRTFAAGESLGLDELAAMLRGERVGDVDARPAPARDRRRRRRGAAARRCRCAPRPTGRAPTSTRRCRRRDVDGCVAAVLGLEQALAAWQADTLQSDDADEARRVLRALVVRLGELAEQGAADPRGAGGAVRRGVARGARAARDAKDFATSDLVRDRLVDAGVEVRDTADGTSWSLTSWSARDPVVAARRG